MCPKGVGPTLEETVALLAARVRHLESLQYTAVASMLRDADGDTIVQVEESADEDMVRMDVAGVEAFHLQDDGILDLARQSRARAYNNAGQSINTATATKIVLDTENYDEQGEFDSAVNYRFQVLRAGYYLVIGKIRYASPVADKVYEANIYVNGAAVASNHAHSSNTDWVGVLVSDVIYLGVDHHTELWTYHNAGVAETLTPGTVQTFMAIHKLS